jgi:hypothetical protein
MDMERLLLGSDPRQHNTTIFGGSDRCPREMNLMACARVGHLKALSRGEAKRWRRSRPAA